MNAYYCIHHVMTEECAFSRVKQYSKYNMNENLIYIMKYFITFFSFFFMSTKNTKSYCSYLASSVYGKLCSSECNWSLRINKQQLLIKRCWKYMKKQFWRLNSGFKKIMSCCNGQCRSTLKE